MIRVKTIYLKYRICKKNIFDFETRLDAALAQIIKLSDCIHCIYGGTFVIRNSDSFCHLWKD